jgi:hypothetical protein
MSKDEALKLALEDLIYASSYCDTYDAIDAVRQALAEPVQESDDSLLLCASDLEHSATYDNHAEMQACIRAVASRIKALVLSLTNET